MSKKTLVNLFLIFFEILKYFFGLHLDLYLYIMKKVVI